MRLGVCHSVLTLVFPDSKWCFISGMTFTFLDKILLLQLPAYQHFAFSRRNAEYAGQTEIGTGEFSGSSHYVALFSTYPICLSGLSISLSPLWTFGSFFFFLNSGSQVWAGSLIEQKDQGKQTQLILYLCHFYLGACRSAIAII